MSDVTANEPAAFASVLLVDDDQDLCAMLSEYLGAEQVQVTAVHDGQAGVNSVRDGSYDAVVMDITMPVLDGFEALRQIRTFSTVPVLMLTARGDETDRIVGLEIGADDYLPKPFNPRELSARLKAILRRARLPAEQPGATELQLGDLALNSGSQSVQLNGVALEVTATEFGVLELLAQSPGQVVRKESISEAVLGRRLTPYDRSLDTHIANLRKKLGPAADGGPRIKTVRGQGYLLVTG